MCGVLQSPTSKGNALTVKCQTEAMIGSSIRIEHLAEYLQICEIKAMGKTFTFYLLKNTQFYYSTFIF